jgi:hypothetical protein
MPGCPVFWSPPFPLFAHLRYWHFHLFQRIVPISCICAATPSPGGRCEITVPSHSPNAWYCMMSYQIQLHGGKSLETLKKRKTFKARGAFCYLRNPLLAPISSRIPPNPLVIRVHISEFAKEKEDKLNNASQTYDNDYQYLFGT